jgi:Prokaryotic homologs of the JAB domain
MTSLTTFKSPVPDRIYITRSALRLIEDEARHGNSTSLENETGGILIGRRLDATNRLELLIIAATGPGDNAYHHPVEFSPDIEYVNGKLQEYHARYPRTDYIGTWHKHPPRYQRFSQGDVDTAHAVFRDPAYKVKEIINPIVWVDQGKFTIRYYYMSRQMARQGDPFYEVQIARIMLIDDDHAMVQREAVASSTTIGATNDLISEEYRLLSEHGYQVKLCNEGAEYFFEVRSERVSDLVIYFVAPANFPQLPPVLMVECGGEALPPNDGGIINQWTYRNGAAHLVDVVEGVMASIPVCLGDLTEVLRCVLPKCAVVRRQNDRHGSIGMTHQPLTASDDSRAERIGYEVKMIRDMGYSCDLQQSPEGMTHYLTVELTRDTMEGPQPVRAYIKLDAEFPASPPMLVVTVLIPGSTSANELNELPIEVESKARMIWSSQRMLYEIIQDVQDCVQCQSRIIASNSISQYGSRSY